MHVGFVQVDKEKMSKSLNNFFTIRDVLAKWPGEVLRYFLIASHYRSPINYTETALSGSQAALERFYLALRGLNTETSQPTPDTDYERRFYDAMDDDFNTPVALAALFDLAREINRARQLNNPDVQNINALGALLCKLGGVLGLLSQSPDLFLRKGKTESEVKIIENAIAARNTARENKNWSEADSIRDQLLADKITLEDTSSGTIWRAS